jgi:hypothetical protein
MMGDTYINDQYVPTTGRYPGSNEDGLLRMCIKFHLLASFVMYNGLGRCCDLSANCE